MYVCVVPLYNGTHTRVFATGVVIVEPHDMRSQDKGKVTGNCGIVVDFSKIRASNGEEGVELPTGQ